MYNTRYEFGETVFVYKLLISENNQRKHYITRIEFKDNLEKKLIDEYSGQYPEITCSKLEIENGKFDVEFQNSYGSYRNSYGPHLWTVELTHPELDESLRVGVQTYIIINILKNNTVVNGKLKDVYLAIKGKDIVLVFKDDPLLSVMRYDSDVRNKFIKSKTVKRVEGYKYITLGSELNYLCDITLLATKISWRNRYGNYYDTSNTYSHAIRCGRLPCTLYRYAMSSLDVTSMGELVADELNRLDKALDALKQLDTTGDIKNINTTKYMAALNELAGSIFYNQDTISSIQFESTKPKRKPLSKATNWLTDADEVNVREELMGFRESCHKKLNQFIKKYNVPLPPEFLNYLFRFDNEVMNDLTEQERAIIKSISKYCDISNLEHNNDAEGVNYYRDKYDTSELYLLY